MYTNIKCYHTSHSVAKRLRRTEENSILYLDLSKSRRPFLSEDDQLQVVLSMQDNFHSTLNDIASHFHIALPI